MDSWDDSFRQVMVKAAVDSIRECGDAEIARRQRRRHLAYVFLVVGAVVGIAPVVVSLLTINEELPVIWIYLTLPCEAIMVGCASLSLKIVTRHYRPLRRRDQRLNRETWLTFLQHEVLAVLDDHRGWRSFADRLLSTVEEEQLQCWEAGGRGPKQSEADPFLQGSDSELSDYVEFCREYQLQPLEREKKPLAWFIAPEIFE